jgi:pyruvate formate lyase activating enzyme
VIAAVHPCSFVDFPGRLAAVIFTQGCDLRCRYCHNPSLCEPGRSNPAATVEFESFLRKRQGLLEGVVVTGGEPTLWNELSETLSLIRHFGFAVKLDSNGLHPRRVDTLLEQGLVDYLAVDVKAQPGARSQWLCGHGNQAELALETLTCAAARNLPHEARTTLVDGIHDLDSLTWIGTRLAQCGTRRWYLHGVHQAQVLDRTFSFSPPKASIVQSALKNASAIGLKVALRGQSF